MVSLSHSNVPMMNDEEFEKYKENWLKVEKEIRADVSNTALFNNHRNHWNENCDAYV